MTQGDEKETQEGQVRNKMIREMGCQNHTCIYWIWSPSEWFSYRSIQISVAYTEMSIEEKLGWNSKSDHTNHIFLYFSMYVKLLEVGPKMWKSSLNNKQRIQREIMSMGEHKQQWTQCRVGEKKQDHCRLLWLWLWNLRNFRNLSCEVCFHSEIGDW